MRIDQLLSKVGYGSRKEVKQLLKKEEICCNGKRIKDGKYQVDPEQQIITVNQEKIQYQKYRYYLLNKPKGCVSATEDAQHRTVLSYLKKEDQKEVFPVGRLDKDTTGLLLLTNNGELSHELLAPKKHVDKLYWAKIDGPVTREAQEAFAKGIFLNEKEQAKPAKLNPLTQKEEEWAEVTISEGKFHQVKRMFHAVGREVLALERRSMGPLQLPNDLAQGEYRPLTKEEISALERLTGIEL